MIPKRDKVALAYLYFILKPHKVTNIHSLLYHMTIQCFFSWEGTPLRPIVSSTNTPTTGISKFLDQLIRPLFETNNSIMYF
jgi:hypothetical protein